LICFIHNNKEYGTYKDTYLENRHSKAKYEKEITTNKKKKLKKARLEQLVPENLEVEKERFFRSKCKYNPQFIYSFEKLRFPVRA
jgi:hypothetical protein